MNNLGRHVILDAYLGEMPPTEALLRACEMAIEISGMHVESYTEKRFQPYGLTAVWVLSESHFTLHTYPESAYISVDCYTCGDEGDPDAAVDRLIELLHPVRVNRAALRRGVTE